MEIDTMSLGLGLVLIMVQVIAVVVLIWVTNGRLAAAVTKILKGQQTIMSFMAKDYQDRALLKVQERTAPANGANQAETLKAVGACLQDEIRTGKVFENWPRIIGALNAGVMPPKNGSAAPAQTLDQVISKAVKEDDKIAREDLKAGPGAADPPAPDQGKKPPTGNNNPKGMAALKALNDKRKAEAAARKAGQAPAPPVQVANDNDEELASLLEQHGYKVTRGSEETLKAIKDQGVRQ
jgi:hypothetical protein